MAPVCVIGRYHAPYFLASTYRSDGPCRVILSDGQSFMQGMLTTPLHHLVDSAQLVRHTIVRLSGYSVMSVNVKR